MNNDTTIGLDLGNKKHKVVGLDGHGKVILKCELNNDKETLGAFFKEDVALLRTIPGVGPITSCAYAAFAPDPRKFGSPRDAGCYFGLTAGQD